jgi:hypothetical protein
MLKVLKKRFMTTDDDVSFGDKNMKKCVECGRNLGLIEGYRHPTMGTNYLVCSDCFDTVSESVEKYREFISPYIGFFNRTSSSIKAPENRGEQSVQQPKKMHSRVRDFWVQSTNKNANMY